jgi:HEAT repeat protein
MKFPRTLLPFIKRALLVLIIFIACNSYSGSPFGSAPQKVRQRSCLTKTEVARAIQEFLPSTNSPDWEGASRRLLKNAKISARCRRQVIDTLMAAMNKPQLDIYQDFHLWRNGANLLGELKATEALDLLIDHLNFTDDASINVSHYPAMVGVMKMGQPALPKLGAALRKNSDVHYRFNAVFCIAQIGGSRAIQELKTALPSESHACLRNFIQVSIDGLNNPRSPGKITGEDRDKWFAAQGCGP